MNRNGIETGNNGNPLFRRLEWHPAAKARGARMLDLIENTGGDLKRAEDAERQAIEELRRMGQELLGEWSHGRADQVAQQMETNLQVVK